MAKFIRGPFNTINEVKQAIEQLKAEGYENSAITVVANREDDLRALEHETPADVKQENADLLVHEEERPFWEQLTDAFTGYFFNQDYQDSYDHSDEYDGEDDDAQEMLAGYREDLNDGKIVLLVDDILAKESQFNLDAVDNLDHRTEEVRDADPEEVMEDLSTERDSHPDIDENEAILEQETTYVPSESMDTYGVQHAEKKYRAVPNETDVTPIFDDPTDTHPQDVPAPGEEDGSIIDEHMMDTDDKRVDLASPENLPNDPNGIPNDGVWVDEVDGTTSKSKKPDPNTIPEDGVWVDEVDPNQ